MRIKGIAAGSALFAMGAALFLTPTAGATAPPPLLKVGPTTVVAGGTLDFVGSCHGQGTEVTSPGLAAPVVLKNVAGGSRYTGHGRAGNRPGHFKASFTCNGGQAGASGTATAEFTVVCTPVPSTTAPSPSSTSKPPETLPTRPSPTEPPTSSATTSAPRVSSAPVAPAASETCSATGKPAPQVPVKPKGAPETGDGSQAEG